MSNHARPLLFCLQSRKQIRDNRTAGLTQIPGSVHYSLLCKHRNRCLHKWGPPGNCKKQLLQPIKKPQETSRLFQRS